MNPIGVFGKKSKQFYFSTLSTQPSCGRIVIEEHSDGFDYGYKSKVLLELTVYSILHDSSD